MSQPEYEFSAEQNQLLARTAVRMKWFAGLLVASPVLTLAMAVYEWTEISGVTGMTMPLVASIPLLFSTFISVVIASLTFATALSLQAVVRSSGEDVFHMVHALSSLKRLFGIQYWLIVAFLLLIVLGIVLMIGVAVVT